MITLIVKGSFDQAQEVAQKRGITLTHVRDTGFREAVCTCDLVYMTEVMRWFHDAHLPQPRKEPAPVGTLLHWSRKNGGSR